MNGANAYMENLKYFRVIYGMRGADLGIKLQYKRRKNYQIK